jgi:hypothetical protein
MKMMLEVDLIGTKVVKISIVQLCEEAMRESCSLDYRIYVDTKSNFVIWSYGEFLFNEKEIKLPDVTSRTIKKTHTHTFKDEQERYESLKKMYITLNKWALDTRLFPNTQTLIEDRIILNGRYWRII